MMMLFLRHTSLFCRLLMLENCCVFEAVVWRNICEEKCVRCWLSLSYDRWYSQWLWSVVKVKVTCYSFTSTVLLFHNFFWNFEAAWLEFCLRLPYAIAIYIYIYIYIYISLKSDKQILNHSVVPTISRAGQKFCIYVLKWHSVLLLSIPVQLFYCWLGSLKHIRFKISFNHWIFLSKYSVEMPLNLQFTVQCVSFLTHSIAIATQYRMPYKLRFMIQPAIAVILLSQLTMLPFYNL